MGGRRGKIQRISGDDLGQQIGRVLKLSSRGTSPLFSGGITAIFENDETGSERLRDLSKATQ